MRIKRINGAYPTRHNIKLKSKIIKIPEPMPGWTSLVEYQDDKSSFIAEYHGKQFRLNVKGSLELQFIPEGHFWQLYVLYDEKVNLFEYYFDITKSNFLDENGIPCIDDLFLDIVVYPDGERLLLDENELADALRNSEITQDEYDFAYQTCKMLEDSGILDTHYLGKLCAALWEQINENLN